MLTINANMKQKLMDNCYGDHWQWVYSRFHNLLSRMFTSVSVTVLNLSDIDSDAVSHYNQEFII